MHSYIRAVVLVLLAPMLWSLLPRKSTSWRRSVRMYLHEERYNGRRGGKCMCFYNEHRGHWDNIMSSDDIPDADELMLLWPDQCVGVGPRCYALDEMNSDMKEVLSRLFDEIPEDATHLQVDCRSDGLALSRGVYALADGFEKSTPTIIAWVVTVVLLFVASTMWCCYGCSSLCSRSKHHRACGNHLGSRSSATYTRLDDACDPERKEMHYPSRTYQMELPQR